MSTIYLERVSSNAKIPIIKTDNSACFDIFADIMQRTIQYYRSSSVNRTSLVVSDNYDIYPGERVAIPIGWKMCCNPGWKIEISPRSGIAFKQGLNLINCTGIIDADFRHEVKLLMVNLGSQIINIKHGMRLAQMSLEKVNDTKLIVGKLPNTNSNRTGGLGSTGYD